MAESRLEYLFSRYMGNLADEQEREELKELLDQPEHETAIQDLLGQLISETGPDMTLGSKSRDAILQAIFQAHPGTKVVPMKRSWVRWVAAASIILVLGVGSYLLFFNKKVANDGSQTTVAKTNDIPAPANTRAVITLADGSKVYLDSVGTGTLATQANITVERSADGKIIYQPTNGTASEVVYNTLSNPRGSKVIDMQLSDGSHVWLNAGSSVRYPVAFIGNERKVEITGEAYFEVQHNASKPFIVSKGDVNVQVLGTHFNVNAYDDEDALRITLLEGSVRVASSKSQVTIVPGTQAVVTDDIKVNKEVDVDDVMAWKNGKFSFNKADIKTVMRELARWYDLDVEYQGEIPTYKFWGDIQRNLPLSETLSFLKESKVKFEIQGKKVIVKK